MASLNTHQLGIAGPLFLEQRRRSVIDSGHWVGLDYVVPRQILASGSDEELWRLELHFLPAGAAKEQAGKKPWPLGVAPRNVRITLGELHDPGVRVQSVGLDEGATWVVQVQRDPGIETTQSPPIYTLELVDLPTVDRFFNRARFVFRSDGTEPGKPAILPALAAPRENPEIDYLAKDYGSFRRLMMERLNAFVPSWKEKHAADLGVTLVELLAYAADYMSYHQDAVATEAYMATARRRISVRRHARLVDYRLHEGCNARCWVQFKMETRQDATSSLAEGFEVPSGIEVLTYSGHLPSILEEGSQEHRRALLRKPLIFRTLESCRLYPDLNQIEIYTWGAESFALSAGTISAALCGHLQLAEGDALIFERRPDPGAESAESIDPRERRVVRLCRPPKWTRDLESGPDGEPLQITEIEWFAEDALPVDFPVSARIGGRMRRLLTVVRGNLVLTEHSEACSEVFEPVPEEGRFNPRLLRSGLTHRVPHDPAAAVLEPALVALQQDPRQALPDIELYALESGEVGEDGRGIPPEMLQGSSRPRWSAQQDLLTSHRFARDFVAEVDEGGFAWLRFGDDQDGRRPRPGTVFQAIYTVGLGPKGNVGAYSLRHAVIPVGVLQEAAGQGFELVEVKNHLAGGGGLDGEPMEKARMFAPEALRSRMARQSCVTEGDYVEIAERHPEVLRAAARERWKGSWQLVELYVQRPAGRSVDDLFRRRLHRHLAPHLLIGKELEILPPRYVPLDIRITVWPLPSLKREGLAERLQQRLVAGEVALLRPGYFTFGKSFSLSELIAEAMTLPEVADVEVRVFQRWGRPPNGELEAGEIEILPLEIAQLENDPMAPHRGALDVVLGEAR